MKKILVILIAAAVVLVCAFCAVYFTRFQSMSTIEKITAYDGEYNLYRMDVKYDYDLDKMLASGVTDNQSFIDAVLGEALPYLPIHMEAPNFGCSAFSVVDTAGEALMGRNYDFKNNTSAMLVYTSPKGGYKSVAFAALTNLSANDADGGIKSKLASLASPFVCLDGLNEKGVSIAVLTLDSEPTFQKTGKTVLPTTLAIRLVLDRATTTAEAVELLQGYDMFATSGRDYHFYITDASGDGRVIEYDCDDPARPLVATPTRTTTNFFLIHKELVLPDQHNGIYGHGRERYDAIEKILTENEGNVTPDVAWEALKTAAQAPKEGDVTSNTQWSILYDNTNLTAEFILRRDWSTVTEYDLKTNQFQK